MASQTLRATKKQKSSKEILAYATSVPRLALSKEASASLPSSLLRWIDDLSEHRINSATPSKELDEQGTVLWNVSSKLKKEDATKTDLVCHIRVFACLLLDCAQRSTVKSVQNHNRVFKSWLNTTKLCLNHGHLALAERAAEKCAYYEQNHKVADIRISEAHMQCQNELTGDYLLLRVTLAWRQNRLDLAQNWFEKLCNDSNGLSPPLAEKLADLLFEIGKDLITKNDFPESVQWLEKAQDVLRIHDKDKLSHDSEELLVAIDHLLVRALMKLTGEEAKQKALSIVAELECGHGDRLAVLMLKLDLFQTDLNLPSEEVYDILKRIVHTVHVTESTFKTIMHHVHSLRSRNPQLAHSVLKDFLSSRLLDVENQEYMEKALVTMVWNLTSSAGLTDYDHTTLHILDGLKSKVVTTLSAPATHAVQMLMWKCIESSYQHERYRVAESWCRLALHSVFENSGEMNTGKLQRKLILCLIALCDYEGARNVYSIMLEACKGCLETQYIMYKVGLRSNDSILASECLDNIYRASSKDATMLYACVLEAQKTGQKRQVLSALQRVLDKYDYRSPPGVYLPALLRCAARLLLSDLEDSGSSSESDRDAICKVFEGAASQAKGSKQNQSAEPFPLVELDWFSRNSYNLSLKIATEWDPVHTLRLVEVCLQFLDHYPAMIDASLSADLSLRRVFCHFLSGSLLVSSARVEHYVETKLQYYLQARKHAREFRTHLQDQLSRLEGGARSDLLRKAMTFLAFDFEAAVQLKSWDDTLGLLEDTQVPCEPKLCGTLADIVLCSEAPVDYVIANLQQIINLSWDSEGYDVSKLSKWIRCLFQVALSSRPEIAESLLDRVLGFAKDTNLTPPYPAEEIEWLATTSFNRAVDFYCASQDADCKRWAEMAMNIANLARDGGTLHELLQTKYIGLSWEH